MRKRILFLFFLTSFLYSYGQKIQGFITDTNEEKLIGINISIENKGTGSTSDNNGSYSLEIPAEKSIVLIYSAIGYEMQKIRIPPLKQQESYTLNITLIEKNNLLNDVIVTDKRSRKKNLSRIKTKHVRILPSSNEGIEAILKTLPGVSSANELSSQYSVRGGNFDENLVYVNGIEIYRPFLIHSGKQEGLSFVNSDLVSSILFSAGGFEARYGDKMSSVLNVQYKRPTENKSSLQLSLLGGKIHMEGINKKKNLTYLIGSRYKTNKYILNSLDTKGDYNPIFYDVQSLITYKVNNKLEIDLLTNISHNIYNMEPNDRETEFGTINEALKVKVFFEGQEVDKYQTLFAAINASYRPSKKTMLRFISSAFNTNEEENFDILGEYFLFQLENNLGSQEFGDIAFDRGVGKYLTHARNKLNAFVSNITHQGNYIKDDISINWGLKWQKEVIEDNINEWMLIDSAFFNFPHPNDNIGDSANPNQEIIINEVLKTTLNISSNRNSGFIQFTKDINNLTINAGTRGSYWDYNNEFLLSPRVSLAFAPLLKQDIVFRAATGIYFQSPFYRELRTLNGTLNQNIKSQKSTHYVLSADYLFYQWGRPFKWITEIYYKDLKNLIPYKVDNVHIQYLSDQLSNGYAKGIDMKINGEFVNGVESWASLSIMKTEEDIIGDIRIDENNNTVEIGYLPRPTDQRVNFSMFFQDYIPRNPNYKMHLNLIYGTGLPFGPPNSEKYEDILRIPDYRRVDIGFSAILKSKKKRSKFNIINNFKSIWISAEVFNLLDINNTVSYLWVSDINGREYAVPNYLTSRQINAKLIMTF
jgi:hypothetical protein